MNLREYTNKNVLTAAKERIAYTFDSFDKIMVSFSGGKDSSVMFHLVMEEAILRNRKVCVMMIDFEAQYKATAEHAQEIFKTYADHIELHWICLPIKLRNGVSVYQPTWTCWDPEKSDMWVRDMPKMAGVVSDISFYPFFQTNLEFEEFIVMFADWYAAGEKMATFVGIRTEESLNRYRTIAVADKKMLEGKRWTTHVIDNVYNIYPIYDWKTKDIWTYNRISGKSHNKIYDLMHQAGVPLSRQRLCQPYGDDQRRGLYLYHILEPESWFKIVARVNGANSGSLYVQETGNITGYNKITCPPNHTYKSFCNLLLSTLPPVSRDHYVDRFKDFIKGWRKRGYVGDLPDSAPAELENKQWVPSWRRLCKVLLRNDYWCKGLGMTQPKSAAWDKYKKMKKEKSLEPEIDIISY
jgi:predicted phosphoadenosine phosphosulfate sulfurtransferase